MNRPRGDCPRRGLSRFSLAATLAIAALLLALPAASPAIAADDHDDHDELGLKPEDGSDKDLALPDPVLDRSWPGPKPGEQGKKGAEKIAPDEDADDPFRQNERREEEEVAPPLPPFPKPQYVPPPVESAPRPPARPPVGPDGRYDAGSPMPEVDPEAPDVLGRDEPEPSELEREEREPSPLDRDDEEFHDEADDPGDW